MTNNLFPLRCDENSLIFLYLAKFAKSRYDPYSYPCLTVLSTDWHWKSSQPQLSMIGSSLYALIIFGKTRRTSSRKRENVQVGCCGKENVTSTTTSFITFTWLIYEFICAERAPNEWGWCVLFETGFMGRVFVFISCIHFMSMFDWLWKVLWVLERFWEGLMRKNI